jgi:hypothetical protein
MTTLQKNLLINIQYYLGNDDLEGLASDLGIIIQRAIVDDDIEDDIANGLALNILENKRMDR